MEDEDDDMRAQENQKILDDINECKEKNNGKYKVESTFRILVCEGQQYVIDDIGVEIIAMHYGIGWGTDKEYSHKISNTIMHCNNFNSDIVYYFQIVHNDEEGGGGGGLRFLFNNFCFMNNMHMCCKFILKFYYTSSYKILSRYDNVIIKYCPLTHTTFKDSKIIYTFIYLK